MTTTSLILLSELQGRWSGIEITTWWQWALLLAFLASLLWLLSISNESKPEKDYNERDRL